MRLSLFMLLYAMTACAGLLFLWRFVDGSTLSQFVFASAVLWFVGAGVLLAIFRNPDRPSRWTFEFVQVLMLVAICLLLLCFANSR
jgi:peptidoglycan/LPS O-acetylase OafA/YrhL